VNTKNHIVHFSTKSSKSETLTEFRPLPVLLKNIQTICIDSLEAKLVNMLNTADDRLFDMSENSYNNAQFDAMRLLRVKREGLISRFKQELANNFKQTLGKINDNSPNDDNVESLSFENIALVKDDDLEEDIATDAMVNKAKTKNQNALEHIRTRIDTLIADTSIGAENNPLEPAYICDAFRHATQALDLDIASLLVIYKLFDRSVISDLESLYLEINHFFIEKGILPDLKAGPAATRNKNANSQNGSENSNQNIIDALPINEDLESNSENAAQNQLQQASTAEKQAGVLSVIQQLLAQQRGQNHNQTVVSDSDLQIPQMDELGGNGDVNSSVAVGTGQLLSALSNIQIQQTAPTNYSSQAKTIDLRKSLNVQLPDLRQLAGNAESSAAPLGQFNEDMIDIVSMLFDFILEDENLQPELKSVIGRLQIPMLKVGLVDKTFFSNRRHPARRLLNELAHAGLSWDKHDRTAQPMFEKISEIAENIIQGFTDDTSLFGELLEEFLSFKTQHHQRATIFERRTKEAEEGKAKTESARGEVNSKLTAICKGQHIPEVVKTLLKTVWSHAMLLERLKDNEEGWRRRIKVAQLLVWTVQPVNTAERLEKMTSKVPLLIKSLKKGVELISFSQIEATHLFEQLENCHRSIIEIARQKINQENEETILRLPAIDLENEAAPDFESSSLDNETEQQEPLQPVEEIIIEDIGFTRVETGQTDSKIAAEPVHIDTEISQSIEQLRAGSWLELKIDGEFKRCKLAARIASSGKYIFVNRSGMKMAEYLTIELCQLLQLGDMKILDDEALFDRALESVISNLRSMKAQA